LVHEPGANHRNHGSHGIQHVRNAGHAVTAGTRAS
jgi:hypothetical protein